MPLDENPYADWSCQLFTADRTQYIIMSNTKSLYSCVMYDAGITDDNRFIERAFAGACLGVSANLKRFLAVFENGRKGKRYIKQLAERWASICRAA